MEVLALITANPFQGAETAADQWKQGEHSFLSFSPLFYFKRLRNTPCSALLPMQRRRKRRRRRVGVRPSRAAAGASSRRQRRRLRAPAEPRVSWQQDTTPPSLQVRRGSFHPLPSVVLPGGLGLCEAASAVVH